MRLRKTLVTSGASLFGLATVLWISAWIQFFTRVPSEQVYVTSVSPDGSRIARFSVKYQGIYTWLPSDIEPHYYVSIVEREHARILLRRSEYHGDLAASFSELAKKHAPWAVAQLTSFERQEPSANRSAVFER